MSADPKRPYPDGTLHVTMTLNGVTITRCIPAVTLLLNPDAAVKQAAETVWRQVRGIS